MKKLFTLILAIVLTVTCIAAQAQIIIPFGDPKADPVSLPYSNPFCFRINTHTSAFKVNSSKTVTVSLNDVRMRNRSARVTADARYLNSRGEWISVKRITKNITTNPVSYSFTFTGKPGLKYQVVIYKTTYKSIYCDGDIDIR